MRWLFLFVLALNLVYIGLEMIGSSDNYSTVPALKNVQPIILLSELKQSQPDLAETGQAEDDLEVVAADGVSIETSSAESSGSALSDAWQIEASQVTVRSQEVAGENSETDAVSALAVQPGTESAATETAVVASQGKPVGKPVEVSPAEQSKTASCFTLGPFRDLGKLRSLTREIKSYVVEADFRGREEKEPTLYWVFVKPEKNRAQAIRTGKRLKARKIKDFYVIREGEKTNGLSLGHFRSKKSAYGLAKKVKNLGFDVMVEPVFRTYTIYWLDYELAGGVNIPESILEKYTRSTKKQKISRLSRDCGA